jgi:hypothetical protein
VSSCYAALNKYLTLLLLLISALAFLYFAHYLLNITSGITDAELFVNAAFRYMHDGEIYEKPYALAPMDASFKFPPIYLLPYLSGFFGHATETSAQVYSTLFWPIVVIRVLQYVLSLVLVLVFFGNWKNKQWLFLMTTIFFLAAPFDEAMTGLTFENLLLFLLVVAFIFLRYGYQWIAAFILAYIGLAKIYPMVIVLFFITQKQWGFLWRYCVANVIWMVVAVLCFGLDANREFYFEVLPILLHENTLFSVMNRSLYAHFAIGDNMAVIVQASLVLLSLLVMFLSNSMKKNIYSDSNAALAYGFSVCLMMLLLRNCWNPYQIILLFPIAILIGTATDPHACWRPFRVVVGVLAWLPLIIGYNSIFHFVGFEKDADGVAEIVSLFLWRDYSLPLLWAGIGCILIKTYFCSGNSKT